MWDALACTCEAYRYPALLQGSPAIPFAMQTQRPRTWERLCAGVFDDDFEDELQDCSIYTQLVGLKNSKKVLYVCIGVGLPIVLIGGLAFYYRRRKSQTRLSSYNQTPLKTFQDA